MGTTVGIDLGTTNSVAAFKFADVEVVAHKDNDSVSDKLTPSVVAWDQGVFKVGTAARPVAMKEHVIKSIKRLMGRSYNDPIVQEQRERFTYVIQKPTEGTENGLAIAIDGREYSPEAISAEILKTVVRYAQEFQRTQVGLKGTIGSAVITIPAYFNDKQRHATKMAANQAGLNCLSLLPEPTAAAISYGFQPGSEEVKTMLVYDFGGGTFDASVITSAGDQFIELSKAGDLWLGGDDVDELIVQYVKQQVAEEEELDNIEELIANLPKPHRLRFEADLRSAAEHAKINLSSNPSTVVVSVTPLLDETGMIVPIEVVLTREIFESMVLPTVERTVEVCREAIALADYTPDLIDCVLLVGGTSQIPLIRQQLATVFGEEKVVMHPSPMYAVAEGAAIVAAGQVEKVGTVSRDYFIKLADDPRHRLIAQGDILPVRGLYTYGLEADNQRLVHLQFFNWDSVHQTEEVVGDMWMDLGQAYPRGTEVLVTLDLDEQNNDLQITAALKNDPSVRISSNFSRGGSDESINQSVVQVIESVNSQGFTQGGINQVTEQVRTVIQATQHIRDPETGRERVDKRDAAQNALEKLSTSVSEDRVDAEGMADEFELLLDLCEFAIPSEQKRRMRDLLAKLRSAVDRNDADDMQEALAQARYEMEQFPQAVRIVQICRMAIQQAHANGSPDARIMLEKMGQMLDAIKNESPMADRHWQDLQPMVRRWIAQDVPTAAIATGLVQV